jgi:hypothetical protein
MSDLGDTVRFLTGLGIEHEVVSAWSGKTAIKLVNVPDPSGPHGSRLYGTEYRFDPFGKFISMTMWYEDGKDD